VDIGQECLILFFCHSIYFPEIFRLTELPPFATVAEYVSHHPSGQSQSTKSDGVGGIGIKTGQGDSWRVLWERRIKSVVPFLFLFLYGCDERFVFCHGSGLPPDCFIGEGAVFSLVYINIPGEKDENDAGNQNQYSASFSSGEIKEFFKRILHDSLF
jgi:hypothetical protein